LIPIYKLPEEDQRIYEEAMKLEEKENCKDELHSSNMKAKNSLYKDNEILEKIIEKVIEIKERKK
jgi:hypothetical protein